MPELWTLGLMNNTQLPKRVRTSISLLWVAWGISLLALAINSFLLHSLAGGIVGIVALALQAIVIYFITNGSNVARILLLVLLFLAIPGILIFLQRIASSSVSSAAMTVIGFSLRVIATYFLFTGESRPWFSGQSSPLE